MAIRIYTVLPYCAISELGKLLKREVHNDKWYENLSSEERTVMILFVLVIWFLYSDWSKVLYNRELQSKYT